MSANAMASQPLSDVPRSKAEAGYMAAEIEVLEGLEPVRRRPGMYIGGTDERALHHLFAEVLDNSMDEAVAGHADRIEVELSEDGALSVMDNGRGIPVDPHPKFPGKSALEVIMTTLHAGGKFSAKAYQTSGGLHGVGVSVVNALSSELHVEVARGRQLYRQSFSRGAPVTGLTGPEPAPNRRGTKVTFRPDPEIFGAKARFRASRLYQMARSKAYLRPGVRILWKCAESLVSGGSIPAQDEFHFPGGLADYLKETLEERETITTDVFAGAWSQDDGTRVEWAIAWTGAGFDDQDGFMRSYCNTIPTPEGGTHILGLRAALTRGLKAYGELKGEAKKVANLTGDDVMAGAGAMVSVFLREPEFQGQTKEKLTSGDAQRFVETAMRDPFDHWLTRSPKEADKLLAFVIDKCDDRMRRRREREVARKSATRKLRLPGKLTDCTRAGQMGTELFIVEGDSAGGSAKQARSRDNQAILPLRGKILNVANATADKIRANQEIADLALAMGVGLGSKFSLDDLRYERIIIMTDADVDGAHIAALLITFFWRSTPGLIESGRLFLALPPLYRLSKGSDYIYARDDADKERLLAEHFKGSDKVEVSRFKGLGEMMAQQLKETTMDPAKRTLARVSLPADDTDVSALVEALMGKKPERRFAFIQDNAAFVEAVDI
jgi:topoisomerase IV subunit B